MAEQKSRKPRGASPSLYELSQIKNNNNVKSALDTNKLTSSPRSINRLNSRTRDHPLLAQRTSNVVEYHYSPLGGSPGKRNSFYKDGGGMSHRLSPLSSHANLDLSSRISPDHSGGASPKDQYVRHGSPRGQLKLPPITINFAGIDQFESTSTENLKKSWYEQTSGGDSPVRAKQNLRRVSSDSQAITNRNGKHVPAITINETSFDTREMSMKYQNLWQDSIKFILEENQKKRNNAQEQCKWLQEKVHRMYLQNKSYKNDDKFKALQEKMNSLMGADWSVPLSKHQEAKVDELIASIDEKHKMDTAQQLRAALREEERKELKALLQRASPPGDCASSLKEPLVDENGLTRRKSSSQISKKF